MNRQKRESPAIRTAGPKPNITKNNFTAENNSGITTAQVQRQKILRALKRGAITTVEAREQLGVLHPAGRVCELRAAGHRIVTVCDTVRDAFGRRHRVARYILRSRS